MLGSRLRLVEALQRAEDAESEAAILAALLARAEALEEGAASGQEDALRALEALADEAVPLLPKPKAAGKRKGEAPSVPFKRFTSADGIPILVGRNSKANDELTLRVAEDAPALRADLEMLADIDLAFARGRLSQEMQGSEPSVAPDGVFHLPQLRHPLLDDGRGRDERWRRHGRGGGGKGGRADQGRGRRREQADGRDAGWTP